MLCLRGSLCREQVAPYGREHLAPYAANGWGSIAREMTLIAHWDESSSRRPLDTLVGRRSSS